MSTGIHVSCIIVQERKGGSKNVGSMLDLKKKVLSLFFT